MNLTHFPVMLEESLSLLDVKDGKTYVDCTLGRAGHSSAILKRIPSGRLIAFDSDIEAINQSRPKLREIGDNFTLIHSNFAYLAGELASRGIGKVDGIFADLGVSSPQFDDPSRGFSYREDAPLDMRMDQSQSLTAAKLVETASLAELTKIFRDYGEEKDAYPLAKAICRARNKVPIQTTFQLVDIIKSVKSPKELAKKGHPAKQAFQALRIAVNREEEALEKLLEVGPSLLNPGGVLAIISFMSLDDRLIKNRFRELCVEEGSRHLPSLLESKQFVLLTRKPILPSPEELEQNRRSLSAKLRAIKKKEEAI